MSETQAIERIKRGADADVLVLTLNFETIISTLEAQTGDTL